MQPAARTTTVIGLVVLVAASCATDGPIVPTPADRLVGEWTSVRESLVDAGGGSWQRTLIVGTDGRVVHRGVSYGLYAGQPDSALSAEVTAYGRLTASTGAFVIATDSVVTRDRATGAFVRTVERDGAPVDSIHYELRGDTLALSYNGSPAEYLIRRR